MKLKEYIEGLNELVEQNPEALEMEVCSSADDEGNYFNPVHFGPTLGEMTDGEFDQETETPNTVCIN